MAQSSSGGTRKKTAKKTTARSKSTRRRSPSQPTLKSFDPRAGKVRGEIRANLPAEVLEAVDHARKVAPEWGAIDPAGRAHLLREVRYQLYNKMDELVEVVSAECGKPRFEALAYDVLPAIMLMLNFEKIAARALKPERISLLSPPRLPKLLSGTLSRIEWRPFGVVGCITPWNYPITNLFLATAPALFAGNTVVIKPSEVTPGVGEKLKEVFDVLPSGVAAIVQGGGEIGAALVDAPCDKISFIGSPVTGRKICEAAAKHLTPVVMELGGMDAAIVCDDVDVDVATSGIAWGSFFNAGQTCCSIERTYVVDSIAEEFKERLLEKLARVRQGEDGELGSLTFPPQLEIVERHVKDAVDKGAKLLAGGPDVGRKNENGSLWYAPTVLEDVTDEMAVVKEETFGPVVTITRVNDEDEAVRRANEEAVNLTASVWSSNNARAERIASRLKAGTISINSHGESAGAAWTTWGGVGESGFGRLNGVLGLREFSVPVHVTRPLNPRMKHIWWYPYDDASSESIKGIAKLFGAAEFPEKLDGARTFISNVGRALKNKF